jgi:hypothetical protein
VTALNAKRATDSVAQMETRAKSPATAAREHVMEANVGVTTTQTEDAVKMEILARTTSIVAPTFVMEAFVGEMTVDGAAKSLIPARLTWIVVQDYKYVRRGLIC